MWQVYLIHYCTLTYLCLALTYCLTKLYCMRLVFEKSYRLEIPCLPSSVIPM